MWESALVAEDHHHTAQYIAEQLNAFGYAADIATTAEEAVDMCRQKRYKLACLDVHLGGTKRGYDVVPFLRRYDDLPPTAVIYITGATDFEVVRACWAQGGEEYLVKPVAPEHLLQATQRAIEQVQQQWSHQLLHATRGLLGIYIATGDTQTFEHSLRVGRATLRVARDFGWGFDERLIVYLAGLLHDIGKAYTGAVLHSSLTTQQWTSEDIERLRHHPVIGAEAAKSAGLPNKVIQAIRHHHERLDGCGYPLKLGHKDLTQIDLLVAAADVTDALMSNRPYRPALDATEAAAELRRVAGTQLACRWANHFAEVVEQGRFTEVFRTPLHEKELASICAPTDWILYR